MLKGLKNRVRRHQSLGVLAIGLLFVTVLTAGAGIVHHNYELAHQTTPDQKQIARTDQETKKTKATSSESVLGQTSSQNTQTPPKQTTKPTNKSQTSGPPSGSAPSSSQENSNAPSVTTLSAHLSINGTAKGAVTVAANSNHCEVLSQAFRNGQISSLDMRYSSQYGTQAVYMIEGVGDSNAVWWTYKVNGSSPPYGCSQMKVKHGDSVHWEYVKR